MHTVVLNFSVLQILFLNKVDLFKDKIRFSGRHLRYFFPDYTGEFSRVKMPVFQGSLYFDIGRWWHTDTF